MNSDTWEFPSGFQAARVEYSSKNLDGSARLWHRLDRWRYHFLPLDWYAAVASDAGRPPDRTPCDLDKYPEEHFQEQILLAVALGDVIFMRALVKAMESKEEMEPEFNAILATIEAFEELFSPARCSMTRADWPAKRVVRLKAEEILRLRRYPTPGKRHWTKIFIAAGLSELPEEKPGRPRKK